MTEESNPRIPRKKGQPANSKKHSDLYTDENPKGTIHGLGFKDVATAKASVSKIRNSSRSHAHKIQAAVAMEQRAREMGKTSEAAVYRKFINSMKKKTKKMNEEFEHVGRIADRIGKTTKERSKINRDYYDKFKGDVDKLKNEEKNGDHEPEMIRSQLSTAERAAKRIKKHTRKKDNFKAWVQSKITKASDYLDTAADYLDGKEEEINEEGLRAWFGKSRSKGGKPGWVQVVSGKPCARQPGQKSTPKCVSSSKRASMTKKERKSAQRRKRKADPNQRFKTGAAKPTYVSTDKPKKKMKTTNESKDLVTISKELDKASKMHKSQANRVRKHIKDMHNEEKQPQNCGCGKDPCITYGKKEMKKESIYSDWKNEELVLEVKDKKGKGSGSKDACYHKVKSRYSVWPSAYASGALVKCRKVGAANWGNSTKKEAVEYIDERKREAEHKEPIPGFPKGHGDSPVRKSKIDQKTDKKNTMIKYDRRNERSGVSSFGRTDGMISRRDEHKAKRGVKKDKGSKSVKIGERDNRPLEIQLFPKARKKTNEEFASATFQQFQEKCWKGYEKKGMKTMFGKRYPNCVKKTKKEEVEVDTSSNITELSSKGYSNYINIANLDSNVNAQKAMMSSLSSGEREKARGKLSKRQQGIKRATNKLVKRANDNEPKQVTPKVVKGKFVPEGLLEIHNLNNTAIPKEEVESARKRVDAKTKAKQEAMLRKKEQETVAKAVKKEKQKIMASYDWRSQLESELGRVDECWKTHKKVGMKMKGGKLVPNCVPKNEEVNPMQEERKIKKKISGDAVFPTVAQNKVKNEIISDEGLSNKNPVKKKMQEAKSPAWQRKAGKSESGGLNAKGVASYRAANPGSKLKTAVTTKPSKLKKGSKAANRRKSFCARMKGMKKRLTSAKTARDPDSRINKSLRKWNC